MDAAAVLGLDVGGTKVAAGLVGESGEVLRSARVPTGSDPWAAVQDAIREVWRPPVRAVGIGCGGPLRLTDGTVSPLNIPSWRGFPLLDRVRSLVGGLPVALGNDAVCMALGEARYGAGRDGATVLGIVVSTGVGGGIVVEGRPIWGRSGNAGHVGHVVAEPDGPPCGCGGRGCVEAIASGPALARHALAAGWRPGDHVDPDAAAVVASARAGDPVADGLLRRAGRALGAMIAGVAAVCDLDTVVVGGGVATRAGDLLFPPLHAAVADHARLSFLRGLRVLPARLGPDAGVVGAAALVLPRPQ